MATVNILSSSFNGKLGEVYGTKQYGSHFVKAIPFSHAPHSKTQTQSVRAFEKLNRLSGGVASVAFPYLNLKNKKMLKHNAVAQWLKPVISGRNFQPSKLQEVIERDDSTEISVLEVDREKNVIRVQARTSEAVDKKGGHAWFVIVFDSFGNVLIKAAPEEDFFIGEAVSPLSQERNYFGMAFRSDKKPGKFFIHGLSLVMTLYVENGILYTSRLPDPENWSVENEILKYVGEDCEISGEMLIIK